MTAEPQIEAVQRALARKGIATRRSAQRLYVAGRKDWKGCAAYVEFEQPDSVDWPEFDGGMFSRCQLRVIPLAGQRNWPYCARVEREIMEQIEGPDVVSAVSPALAGAGS
jgi:hypothetical protein